MSSSLTYQLQQQQQQQVYDKHDDTPTEANLPSPPHSSCGDEHAGLTSSVTQPSPSTQQTTNDGNHGQPLPTSPSTPQPIQQQQDKRRDSLQSHFSTLTLQAISNSLPANYTIDHSSIKTSLHQALATTVAAAAAAAVVAAKPYGTNANHTTTPIPIETTTCTRGSSQHSLSLRGGNTLSNSSSSSSSAMHHHHHYFSPTASSAVATAAATGGLSIRHSRRPSSSQTNNNSIDQRKQRILSPPPSSTSSHSYQHSNFTTMNTAHLSSTSLPTTSAPHGTQYRCEQCGKTYKSPSCLTKHRWEHSEEWELTSKLLLTKHQQVQMLEAAAILVSMDPSSNNTTGGTRRQADMDAEEDEVDILNDDDDDDEESIQVDIDDDDSDMMMEMDQEDDRTAPMDQQEHAFPSMVGSTPAMLPSSFTTTTTHFV